jgi:hypothetical protein
MNLSKRCINTKIEHQSQKIGLLHYLNFSNLNNYENELFYLINSTKELAPINEVFNSIV